MPQIIISVAPDDVPAAGARLDREIERLEGARKHISKIHYPPRYAEKLGGAQGHNRVICRGHPASAHAVIPYEIVIEYED